MAKKKKNKKSNPNRNASRPRPTAGRTMAGFTVPRAPGSSGTPTLSLCMITKNEEKNMELALGWAKNVTFEQIVVDTGSTDRTVEIAEHMGAKVFHFEWIDDFSAAKNYAVEQASGSWVVFFDADEYFLQPDAERLKLRISQIESSGAYPDCLAIGITLINLDDSGAQISQLMKVCAFRNRPNIRYEGRIHEMLNIPEKSIVHLDDTVAYHTGYSESVSIEKQKSDRNAKLLREELRVNPNDMNIKAYLADALTGRTDEESINEAAELYTEVLESKKKVYNKLRVKAYLFFIRKYMADTKTQPDAIETCQKALKEFPDTIDFTYYLGHIKRDMGNLREAFEILKECEAKLKNPSPRDESIFLPAAPIRLYGLLMMVANAMGDSVNVFNYSFQILTIDRTKQEVLTACIGTATKQGITEAEMKPFLSQLYDFSNPAEREFVIKAASDAGATGLTAIL